MGFLRPLELNWLLLTARFWFRRTRPISDLRLNGQKTKTVLLLTTGTLILPQ